MYLNIFLQFIFKLLDNALGTVKTICINKDKHLFAALAASASNFFYLTTTKAMVKDDSDILVYVLCVAVFLGVYLPGTIFKKARPDSLYIFSITADTLENGINFADKIRSLNIAIKTYSVYDSNMQKTLNCEIYCKTKEESTLVEKNILPHFKYNIQIPDKY